ncbi:hypothetical protein GC173_17070 [bacterium]|nr:hypothetical protein [bacterium]
MRPKDEENRSTADAERKFLGLAREGQMSTVLPGVRYLSQDELRVLFSLALVAVRKDPVVEAEAAAGAKESRPRGSIETATGSGRTKARRGGKYDADFRR